MKYVIYVSKSNGASGFLRAHYYTVALSQEVALAAQFDCLAQVYSVFVNWCKSVCKDVIFDFKVHQVEVEGWGVTGFDICLNSTEKAEGARVMANKIHGFVKDREVIPIPSKPGAPCLILHRSSIVV